MFWRPGANAQGANLNVSQEEMVRNLSKRPKNEKMKPVPALINSLYGTFGKRPFLAICGGGPRGSPSQEELLF